MCCCREKVRDGLLILCFWFLVFFLFVYCVFNFGQTFLEFTIDHCHLLPDFFTYELFDILPFMLA